MRLDKKNVNERWMPYFRNFARRLLGASPATKQLFGREKQVRRCRQSEMWWVSRGNGFGILLSSNKERVLSDLL